MEDDILHVLVEMSNKNYFLVIDLGCGLSTTLYLLIPVVQNLIALSLNIAVKLKIPLVHVEQVCLINILVLCESFVPFEGSLM